MAEGIVTPDGKPVNIDPAAADQVERDFARVMSEPAGDNDKRPPRRAERAPEPPGEAPRVKRGRPAKPAPAAASAPSKTIPARDYTPELTQLGESLWAFAAGTPWTAGYAVLLNEPRRAQLATAWNQAAQQNEAVRAKVDRLARGDGGLWVLPVAMATIPMALGAWEIYSNKTLREQLARQSQAELMDYAKARGLIPDLEAQAA